MASSLQMQPLPFAPARDQDLIGPTGVMAPVTTAIGASGWTCDRTPHGMEGAAYLARRAARRFGLGTALVGTPRPAADLPWDQALMRGAPAFAAARDAVAAEIAAGRTPLSFLNRCGTSLGTLPPVLARHPDAVLIWCDAHADYNTPDSTPTGYLGGMVITALCGHWTSGLGAGLSPDRVILGACRDIDPAEADLMARDRVLHVPGQGHDLDVDRIVAATRGRPVIFHMDCDVLDPVHVTTEYRIPSGMHPAAMRRLTAALARNCRIAAIEITEFERPADPDHAAQGADLVLSIVAPLLDPAER